MNTQHTRTPWTFKGERMRHNSDRPIYGPDGIIIAFAADQNQVSLDAEVDANAAFIVRAVNCHEELVRALKVLMKFEDNMPKGEKLFLDELIAKAEGKI